MNSFRSTLVLALLTLLAGGCYRYRDVTADALRPGTRVRTRISAVEAQQLARQLGSERRVLDGEVVAADASAVMLEVQSSGEPTMGGSALRQRVSIVPGSILEIQVRELDRLRTAGAVAAGLAAAAAAAFAIDGGLLGGGNDKPGPDENIMIPIGRLRLPR